MSPYKTRLLCALIGSTIALTATAQKHSFLDSYEGATTCLQCHAGIAADVMETIHWTWEKTDETNGNEVGKINVINNYCIAVQSNEPRCTSCHIGIGWTDKTFDHSDSSQIDCLVCHDQTGTYAKTPTGAGAPDPGVNLLAVAQSVGKPNRKNCGDCHFYGGGGEGVKHGTMDSSLLEPSRELDVHMGGSADFQCTSCHTPDEGNEHMMLGSRYSKPEHDAMLCQSCHEAPVHGGLMDMHTSKVACQTCHIPEMARGGKPTKMYWDWSTAGDRNDDGSDKVIKDENGWIIYHSKKGTFEWDVNIVPEYAWFNGTMTYATLEDAVTQGQVVELTKLGGDIDDPTALIFPIKRFVGNQPYDSGANTLAIPNLFGPEPEAYWKGYDWEASLSSGMAYNDKPYVGPAGFIESEMIWIQNHMVAPKEMALTCTDCHVVGSRMSFEKLGYPPERAEQLQTLKQEDYWAGYPVYPDGVTVDTDTWLGWVDISAKPWVWVYDLSGWAYVDESAVSDSGGWVYITK